MTVTQPKVVVDARRRIWLWIAVGVVIVGGAIWAIVALLHTDMPRLNDNAVVLTKFICTGKFDKLPYDEQRQYYKVLDDRDAELDQAYHDKRLTESEYRTGLEAAWLGKHINRVEKYFALPPGQGRATYLNKLVDKKERKKAKPNDPNDIDPDETAAELKVEKWPASVRSQWELFHKAYHEQKVAREKAMQPQTKPASTSKG